MMSTPARVLLVMSGILLASVRTVAQTAFTITDLGTLGGVTSSAAGISSSGIVVGNAFDGGGARHLVTWSHGVITDLGSESSLSLPSVTPTGINAAGQISGYSIPASGLAFAYSGGASTAITPFASNYSAAYAINNSGLVVGESSTGGSGNHAFTYLISSGVKTDLGTLGGDYSNAWGINNAGVVVGESNLVASGPAHAFYFDGAMHDLGTLGGSSSLAYAINAAGHVVGRAYTAGGNLDAFYYDGATMQSIASFGPANYALSINSGDQVVGYFYTPGYAAQRAFYYDPVNGATDLNSVITNGSGWLLTQATGINNAGQIVGAGTIAGQSHAFLLTPIPEPSVLAIALGGIALAIAALRRRGRAVE